MTYLELADRLRPHRRACLLAFDALSWCAALAFYTVLRVDLDLSRISWPALAGMWIVICGTQLGVASAVRLYQGRAALGSLDEMMLLGTVVTTTGLLAFTVNAVGGGSFLPRSVPVAAAFIALAAMAFARATWRRRSERSGRFPTPNATPVLIFGAGTAGRQLVRSMFAERNSLWIPVGLIDDDPLKRHLRIEGVPVVATRTHLREAADLRGAEAMVIALPSASAQVIRELSARAHSAGLPVKVLPGLGELLDHRVGVSDVRDIAVTDLLGRHQVDTDLESIASSLTGKRVLVTGAGGSIGSELCRQIQLLGPAQLIMFDRDESALHAVELSLHGRALLDSPELVLGDIRDAPLVTELFAQRRPQVVFHAAALKHLPMLEQYPGEAVKTNIWGTLTVLEAARAAGVERFVNISTDKAANPVNVLGYTKRIAERLTADISRDADGTYLSVRFGNVLGSRGSVLTAFAAQIAAGGPLTVTHPQVTRFFMTVQEAVQLVVQAAAIGRDGEALILDMGDPVRIDEVARRLIDQAGTTIEIQYTGLRPGEKLHEVRFGAGEPDERPVHPLVSHVCVAPLDPDAVRTIDPWSAQTLSKVLVQLAGASTSYVEEPHR